MATIEDQKELQRTAAKIIHLVKHKPIMTYWRRQVQRAFRNAPPLGEKRYLNRIEDLPAIYWTLAVVHDQWGGLKKIITDKLHRKKPKTLCLTYYASQCEILLANVKVDLEERGFLPEQADQEKTEDRKPSSNKKKAKRKGRPKLSDEKSRLREAVLVAWQGARNSRIHRQDFLDDLRDDGIVINGKICKLDIDLKTFWQWQAWDRTRKARRGEQKRI